MKVLFVISSLNTGGAQRALSNVVTNLPVDWEIDILLNNTENIVYPYRGNLINLGIREPANRESAIYLFKVLIKRFVALRKLKRTGSYDACVSFLESANIANVITGKRYCRTIVSIRTHLSWYKSFFRRFINSIIKHFYNRADCVITLSKGVEFDLIRNLGINRELISTIHNGFPLEEIRTRAGQRFDMPPNGAFTFITAGRFEQPKGQWHLLRAFAGLVSRHDDSRLVILGSGSYAAYLNELIDAYHMEDKVSLKGFIDNPYRELISADVFVFPSLLEGFGNALLEAMVCELPVIASDYRYGAREVLAPDTDIDFVQTSEIELAEHGIITPVCSGVRHSAEVPLEPQEMLLLDAMELMYADNEIRSRYRTASKKRAKDFSIEKCVEKWRRVIEES